LDAKADENVAFQGRESASANTKNQSAYLTPREAIAVPGQLRGITLASARGFR
jgi:hypothetical protein